MTAEEKAFNYASTQKCTKLQVGEIDKHHNNGHQQAIKQNINMKNLQNAQ